jgi:hypothetical protein
MTTGMGWAVRVHTQTYLACALLLRGPATIADVGRNVAKLKPQLRFVKWNPEGFKVGLCSVPPAGLPYSLLQLGNNCCIRNTFTAMEHRFHKLYRKRVFLHHYTQVAQTTHSLHHAVPCTCHHRRNSGDDHRLRSSLTADGCRPGGTQYMDGGCFDHAAERVRSLVDEYAALDADADADADAAPAPHMHPVGV